MANPWFRFKEFIIEQDRTVMKVCTDSCLLGAWTAIRLLHAEKILDIGAGSGLLTLMLAQKSNAGIDCIESDEDSAQQAVSNIRLTSWHNRIQVFHADARTYPFTPVYDFIITNPPFFESDLPSPDRKKNRAKHDQSLTLEQLMTVIGSSLKSNGFFSILLPWHRTDYFINLAETRGFFLREKLIVRQTPAHEPFRTIALFGYQEPDSILTEEMSIKDEKGKYTDAFSALMKDYY